MPGALQAIQVNKTPQRIQTWLAPNESFLLVNNDITNQIFIGNDPGTQAIPVPPLGSISLGNSSHDIWISTGGVAITVQGLLFPSGTQWTPSPAQVAAQINALGLAKDTTVNSVVTNTTGVAKDATVGTVATNTTGVAKDATLSTNNTLTTSTNTILGVPAQTADVTGLTTNGIPPLRGTNNLGNATGQTIATGVNATLVNVASINKPGFEAVFSISIPAAAGTVPFCILQVIWTDSNTGLTVGQKQYVLVSGNGPSNVLTYYLSGPCRGNQLTVKLRNQDPAQTATVTWAVNQTSHVYLSDRLLQPLYATTAPITFTNPNGNPSKGLLFSSTPTIGPNTSVTRLCACSNAKVKVSLDNTVQLNPCALQINTPSATGLYEEAAAPATLLKLSAAIGGQASTEWQMPNGAVTIQIFNQAATNNIAPNVNITIVEY
jgi:hypothetical protein